MRCTEFVSKFGVAYSNVTTYGLLELLNKFKKHFSIITCHNDKSTISIFTGTANPSKDVV